MSIRGWLRLVRLPNTLTAAADVLAGVQLHIDAGEPAGQWR